MIKATATCDNGHSQTLTFGEGFSREYVSNWAALLDGTSSFYVYSPIGTDSVIGKCGICNAQIHCTVAEEP